MEFVCVCVCICVCVCVLCVCVCCSVWCVWALCGVCGLCVVCVCPLCGVSVCVCHVCVCVGGGSCGFVPCCADVCGGAREEEAVPDGHPASPPHPAQPEGGTGHQATRGASHPTGRPAGKTGQWACTPLTVGPLHWLFSS